MGGIREERHEICIPWSMRLDAENPPTEDFLSLIQDGLVIFKTSHFTIIYIECEVK